MNWDKIGGYFDYEALYARLARELPAGGVFVEVGSLYGRSMAYMGQTLRQLGKHIHLHCVDNGTGIDDTAPPGWHIATLRANLKAAGVAATVHCGDSVDMAMSFPLASVDIVFLDADHSYEAVIADILAWMPRVKPGGLLCGHDYHHPHYPGVKRAVTEYSGVQSTDSVSCWELRV